MTPGLRPLLVCESVEVGALYEPACTPQLPRTTEAVDGLWFVGDGSTLVGGMYMETSASAGMLGARGIATPLSP